MKPPPLPFALLSLLIAVALSSCSTSPPDVAAQPSLGYGASAIGSRATSNAQLEHLMRQRQRDAFSNRLAIGPGDVIQISVPGVPELKKYKTRVSEDGTISVPLAGVVSVGGLTEAELRKALYDQLKKPIKNPQVEVYVTQYRSREVAVVGMVHKPGVYTITSRSDTVLDMIDQAGGPTDRASSLVLFIPAPKASDQQRLTLTRALAASAPDQPERVGPIDGEERRPEKVGAVTRDQVEPEAFHRGSTESGGTASLRLASLMDSVHPIQINLAAAARNGELDVPVRPGDVIIVPAAGEVMVDGWVANPGAFRIVPGMTALSAVSAAGGALFSQTAEVLRTDSDGNRRAITIDLSKVKDGAEPDVPIQPGDVVWVQRSAIGAVPYAFYELFTKFGTGMFLPVP
jgi:polysaccharide biosynthesis/export protein